MIMMGIARDHKTPYKKLRECHQCNEKFKKGDRKTRLDVYDDPWATEPCQVAVHTANDKDGYGDCLDKLTDSSWSEWNYQECPVCERTIIYRCLDNGWRTYFKIIEGEEICVKCYQNMTLEHGEPLEKFKDGKIPGDFYSPSDLNAHGWTLVPGYSGNHISNKESIKRFAGHAVELISEDYKILVDYDSMGIGGQEGYVSLYVKGGKNE
jgi:hypothetical protein